MMVVFIDILIVNDVNCLKQQNVFTERSCCMTRRDKFDLELRKLSGST